MLWDTSESKYHPLFEHLLYSGKPEIKMTFEEIERLIGGPLPKSARMRPEWWSNNPAGHSQAQAWMRASYKTGKVDRPAGRVTFVLDVPQGSFGDAKQALYEAAGLSRPVEVQPTAGKRVHPAFGSLQGTSIILPGVDLTTPTSLLLEDSDDQ
jgi:hypothetical protein